MTLTIERKQPEPIEVELPAYYKNGKFYYKILDQDAAVRVQDFERGYGIEIDDHFGGCILGAVTDGERITEEEFCEAFYRVGEKLKRELIKAIETDQWIAQEKEELQIVTV